MSIHDEKAALKAAVGRMEEQLPRMPPEAQDAAVALLRAVTPLIVRLAESEAVRAKD